MAIWAEAVEIGRQAAEADPRRSEILVKALAEYQRGLCDIGRRAEALDACREAASAGRRAYESGFVASPTFGSWHLACRLAEEGGHAEAAALFDAMVHDGERGRSGDDFWTRIAWIAEMEAAGQVSSAVSALQALIDDHRRRAQEHASAYRYVIWEQLLLSSMDREHRRTDEAEARDQQIEAVLTMLVADDETKNWGNMLAFWAVLIGLTGRNQDRPAPGEPEAPVFLDLDWSPDIRRDYLGPGRDNLESEMDRIAELAGNEPSEHLSGLVEFQRRFTLRSVKYWKLRTWRIADELRLCFDTGVELARRLVEVDEPLGRAALARALTDRTSLHVAARDFSPALRDFRQARQVAAGGRLA